MAKQIPVLINYSVGKSKYEKAPDSNDLQIIERIGSMDIPYWVPTEPIIDGFSNSCARQALAKSALPITR